MNSERLASPFLLMRPDTIDRRVLETLGPLCEGDQGNVTLHLDFNARLVTALREQRLWPPSARHP